MPSMASIFEFADRDPRRGELNDILPDHTRRMLHDMHAELRDLQKRAMLIKDDFLAALIGTAADEARDQLRDDLMMREAGKEMPGGLQAQNDE